MRDIKFRAWDNISKKMYPYALIGGNGELNVHKNQIHNGEWINIGCGREDGEVDYDNVLMQYTGLKDKNGKEIYEGDIITEEVTNTLEGEYETYMSISKVVFDKGGFCKYLMTPRGSHVIGTLLSFGYTKENSDNFLVKEEVIGNFYENPELLKYN